MRISYKVLFAAVLSIAGTNAFAADVSGLATTNYVKGAIGSLDSTVTTANGAIDTVTQTDGKITATHKLLKNADIATDAAIAVSKISGAQTAGNMVNPDSDGNLVAADKTSTTKYPSMAAAQQIATAAAATQVSTVTSRVNTLEADLDALSATVETNNTATTDAINALDGTGTGTTTGNGMVKLVTQTDGKVTATRGLVEKTDLAATVQTSLGKADTALQAVPVATASALGGVKSGTDITVATTGAVTVNHAASADNATTAGSANKATQDASGNVITSTYATKTDMNTGLSGKQDKLTTGDNGNIKGAGSVTVTKDTTTGVITVSGTDTKYTLPTATTTVKGGIMATGEIAVATDGKATIAANAVTEAKIATNAVSSGKIAANAVSEAKIATDAVTTAKIKNANVTTAKIADDAVTTAKIKGYDNTGATKECADGNCALVDLGSGAQWLPIVNEYK